MKNNKLAKALLLVLCAILLVCASVVGTLAYLTAGDEVTNTFTVGKVEISMDETDVNEHGVKDGDTRVKMNTYQLIPGRTYVKDPIVYVTAESETCYVFIKVQNDIVELEDSANTIEAQILANHWLEVPGETGVYYQKVAEDAADKTLETFASFKIDIEETKTTLAAVDSETAVVVTAYAIQAENVEDVNEADDVNAKTAWDIVKTKENT